MQYTNLDQVKMAIARGEEFAGHTSLNNLTLQGLYSKEMPLNEWIPNGSIIMVSDDGLLWKPVILQDIHNGKYVHRSIHYTYARLMTEHERRRFITTCKEEPVRMTAGEFYLALERGGVFYLKDSLIRLGNGYIRSNSENQGSILDHLERGEIYTKVVSPYLKDKPEEGSILMYFDKPFVYSNFVSSEQLINCRYLTQDEMSKLAPINPRILSDREVFVRWSIKILHEVGAINDNSLGLIYDNIVNE